MGYIYADESRWDKVADALNRSADRGDPAGLDTEFYGVDSQGEHDPTFDVRKESCAGGRTRIHLWSVAIKRWPHVLHPRGFHVCDAAVLLAPALDHPGLRKWLESTAPKVLHNRGVDDHSFFNHGILLGGSVNSLATSRWAWPGRARGAGFGLDSLGVDLLGVGKADSFEELFSEEVTEVVRVKEKHFKICSCGLTGCRKRKGHEKTVTVVQEPVTKTFTRPVPLNSVVPGHRLWERAVAYSARDAILAVGVDDKVKREMGREIPWPW